MRKNILIAEDEKSILRLLKNYFQEDGYLVFDAKDGSEALEIFKNTEIDIACLDIMMPKMSGFEVAKIIRSQTSIPIVLLTALSDEENILKGYSLYIDDYITKPFNPKVLIAKCNALLLRTNKNEEVKKDYIVGNFRLDFIENKAYLKDKKLQITDKEFELLAFLIKNNDRICTREMILDALWGDNVFVDNRIIDTYVKNIRKALGNNKYVETIYKKGYRFNLNI